jgi:hypothetical protein
MARHLAEPGRLAGAQRSFLDAGQIIRALQAHWVSLRVRIIVSTDIGAD